MGKGSAMKSYCTIQLPHARPTMHSPSYWGERSEPHTCGENGKLSIYLGRAQRAPHLWCKRKIVCLYIYIFIYLYIYIYGTYVFRIYTSCPICARCNISTLHVGSCNHCCPREKTSRTERLNSGKQRTET